MDIMSLMMAQNDVVSAYWEVANTIGPLYRTLEVEEYLLEGDSAKAADE
jgi:hypothetical protein